MTERELQDQGAEWLKERRIPFIRSRMDKKTTIPRGWPDFTILWMRKQIMIECKTPSGKLSADQVKRIEFLRSQGNVVEIARNLSEFISAVYKVLCEGRPAVGAYGACNYPLEGCFKELKRAVAAVPGNGTIPITSIPNTNPQLYVGPWKGKTFVFAPEQGGAYRVIREASACDIAHLPKLP